MKILSIFVAFLDNMNFNKGHFRYIMKISEQFGHGILFSEMSK